MLKREDIRTKTGELRKPKVPPIAPELLTRLQRVRLLLMDVDGVLTDGGIYIGGESEFKRFNIQDGLGIKLAQKGGIKVGWISARPSFATATRAVELKIDYIFQADTGKIAAAEDILKKAGLGWSDVCFMGDDVVDLGLMKRAGAAISVANGIAEAKEAAHYVTKAAGGHGAVREAVTLILKAQNKWDALVHEYQQR